MEFPVPDQPDGSWRDQPGTIRAGRSGTKKCCFFLVIRRCCESHRSSFHFCSIHPKKEQDVRPVIRNGRRSHLGRPILHGFGRGLTCPGSHFVLLHFPPFGLKERARNIRNSLSQLFYSLTGGSPKNPNRHHSGRRIRLRVWFPFSGILIRACVRSDCRCTRPQDNGCSNNTGSSIRSRVNSMGNNKSRSSASGTDSTRDRSRNRNSKDHIPTPSPMTDCNSRTLPNSGTGGNRNCRDFPPRSRLNPGHPRAARCIQKGYTQSDPPPLWPVVCSIPGQQGRGRQE